MLVGNSLGDILSSVYPEHIFSNNVRSASHKKTQSILKTLLGTVFPNQGNNFLLISLIFKKC